jgi:hypothetical protein
VASPEGSGPESSSENHRRHPRGPRGFESRSIQGGVWCEPDFRFEPGKLDRAAAREQVTRDTRPRGPGGLPCGPRSALVRTLVALAEHFAQYLRQQSLFAHQQRRTLGPARRDVGQHQGLYKAAPRDRPTVGHQVRRRECCYGRVSRAKLPTGRVPVPRWYSETTLR